ncbi:MAG TPA: asparagine synthase (glutamine-hydrolyzing) [Chthoniobacterales bacterium]
MCGIAGYVSADNGKTDRGPLLRQLAAALEHRGPDDEGYFEEPGVGLAIRRLSIVDLPGSHQPISNEDGTVHVVFNGEIYNYVELRAQLSERGHRFRTNGDTETLVHLYEEHGVEMLQFLRGMFAFALWDSRQKTLLLARDRLGKKPLNYIIANQTLSFCSELAPLLDAKLAAWEIDPESVAAYLMFGFVSAPQTMVRQIRKLPPAHYLLWRGGEMQVQRYWSLRHAPKTRCSYAEALEEVKAKLDENLRLRLRSDVPLGLLLSGGVDSNALLARLVRGLGQKVQAFTIGFAEKAYDESDLARASAKHFGVEHHVLMGSTDLLKLLPEVVRHYGEPSADKSALPTMLVCELTRRHVKVALSGDGGDEAFAGYPKHQLNRWQHRASRFFSRETKEQLTLAAMRGEGPLGNKTIGKLRRLLLPETPSLFSGEFFSGSIYQEITTAELQRQSDAYLGSIVADFWSGPEEDPLERILHWDYTQPLPSSLLTKLDIASMARSLEVRSPFLDHELVELCARLPTSWKANAREGKLMLRDIVADDLPPEILHARKRGFSVPLADWWRGEARQQIRDGIAPLHSALKPFLNEKVAMQLLDEHQAGRENHAQRLWNLWVLNEWARTFLQQR